ncbi:ribosome-associated toxin RatA of RatAB toxin-antitoxin module [Tamilnaduibacter salinus]|uniref:Ribosome-associated toxin RatA of RatAB toxin-antitoxin module n=1 Tax=Tamilnaduibacter salinus TaxID=1484056 RepID=A0A2A2I4Y5_9GAMM|nr:type II toxin-antitoxin system RatA family toxin [Tamilnaduibacter salinus]PAV26799.1 ubiquinone-binding protein [Tamilnaduibacter salinus]PVY75963.1 ribosome-associated toxin RatA of RatAB toxin-antitoxin module [Tamilnaduibacter salinus]
MAHTIEKSALVWYSAGQMFDLVNDIGRYPEFLPWCAGTEIHESGPSEIIASIDVARSGVRHRLTTRNRLSAPETIDMALVDGPFQSLAGGWRFQPLEHNACKVVLVLDFAFSGSLSRMTFGKVFSQAANTMVDAFCQRAIQVYGRSS